MATEAKSNESLRGRLRERARDAWIRGRRYVQPRLLAWVDRTERALGVLPERKWYDQVDTASDQSFPASDPPSHSSPRAGMPRGH